MHADAQFVVLRVERDPADQLPKKVQQQLGVYFYPTRGTEVPV